MHQPIIVAYTSETGQEDNLSIMDKMIRPNVSVIQRFYCTYIHHITYIII